MNALPVVILCGGKGTRLREHTEMRPKPMIEVGGRPVLWHIMKLYAHHGAHNFVLCLGYKGDVIRDYFANYRARTSDMTVDLSSGDAGYHHDADLDARVTLIDTGQDTMTGSRIARVAKHLQNQTFAVTYGDGVADVNLAAALKFHRSHGKAATVTGVRPTSRFGELHTDAQGARVTGFSEKPRINDALVNGGFFFFEPRVLDLLDESGTCVLEHGPLQRLAEKDELRAFWHDGYWQCMDTYRDWELLEAQWSSGRAPWRVW